MADGGNGRAKKGLLVLKENLHIETKKYFGISFENSFCQSKIFKKKNQKKNQILNRCRQKCEMRRQGTIIIKLNLRRKMQRTEKKQFLRSERRKENKKKPVKIIHNYAPDNLKLNCHFYTKTL